MTVFIVTISQGSYEDRTERVLIFSSLDKVWEWKDSYETPYDSFYISGEERAIIEEREVDTNELVAISDSFNIPVKPSLKTISVPSTASDNSDLAALQELRAKLEATNSSL